MLAHWIWYAMLPGLSRRQKLDLLERFSDPEDIYFTEKFDHIPELTVQTAEALEDKDLTGAQQVLKTCAEKKIGILTIRDGAYPDRLRNIHEPPIVLYYKGVVPDFDSQPVIAVVGTRKASAYGMTNARQLSGQIAACGGLVVSGGAYGIDTAALEGALDAGRQVVAVLGCGADVVYPRTNRALFARIEDNGCLLSEYLPGSSPKPWQFPERNRILSGLSHGVLVVEAPEKSGALITARDAFEQGRDVYVVPTNIGISSGEGSNKLLQEYGRAALSGWDVLKDYEAQYPGVERRNYIPGQGSKFAFAKVSQPQTIPAGFPVSDKKDIDNRKTSAYSDLENQPIPLSEKEKKIIDCLTVEPMAVDDVIARTELTAGEVLGILTKLALRGIVINHPGRMVSARK